jgi:hypothetical protein
LKYRFGSLTTLPIFIILIYRLAEKDLKRDKGFAPYQNAS